MSDTEFTPKGPRAPTDREKSAVEPIPKRVDFFEWLEKLYDGPSQFPEKIDVRVVAGKNYERLGPMIKQVLYGPKDPKPPKEGIVKLTNEILFLMQRDCDIQRKPMVYGVHVSHLARDTDYYERWLIRCQPGQAHMMDGAPRNGMGGGGDDDDPTMGERFQGQALGHHERMFTLYSGAFEGILDRMDRVLERQESRIQRQDERIEKMGDMLERALSMEEDRAQRRAWNTLKVDAAKKGLDMGIALAPPLLNGLMGKDVIPTKETPETITLKNFFKKKEEGGLLTQDQAAAAFGTYEDKPPHALVRPGVLTVPQVKVLYEVSQCGIPPDELDRLMPGGDLAISGDQIAALTTGCGFSPEQMIPLHAIFEARMKRKAAAS